MPLRLMYKVVFDRPEPQGGGLYHVYHDTFWMPCTVLDPIGSPLKSLGLVPNLTHFPYLTCDTVPVGNPPAGTHWAYRFTLYPVANGIPLTPIVCWVDSVKNPDVSPAQAIADWAQSITDLYADETLYPHYTY